MESDLEEYQMVVHLFGAASSPSCSNFALRKTAEDNSQYFPEAVVSTVKNNFYVDDCLKALSSVEEASHHASDLRSLLSKGSFRLTKWISSSRRVLETIPESERAKEVKTLDLSRDDLPVERDLGVQWCVETDTFGFRVDIKFKPPTNGEEFFQSLVLFTIPSVSPLPLCYRLNGCFRTYVYAFPLEFEW